MKKKKNVKKRKKILRTIAIISVLGIGTLIAAPFIFKDKIMALVQKSIQENVNATVSFSDVTIGFFKNFPKASIGIENITVVNKAPFLADTLLYAKSIDLELQLKELLKKSITVDAFTIENAKVNIIVDENQNANYDIAIETPDNQDTDKPNTTVKDSTATHFNLAIASYKIIADHISYTDKSSNMQLELKDLIHQGKGNLSQDLTKLATHTQTYLSFTQDNQTYANAIAINLDATLELDTEKQIYRFLDNTLKINELPIIFDGFTQLKDDTTFLDITFKTPTSDFKNAIALLPKTYRKQIADIKTKGSFSVSGFAKGVISDTQTPAFALHLNAKDAMVHYPNLPHAITGIQLKTSVVNTTDKLEHTVVRVKKAAFTIDEDHFSADAKITNLMHNPTVGANAVGTINLANLKKAYPSTLQEDIAGIITADVHTFFDQKSIEKQAFENTKTNGTIGLSGFSYDSKEMKHPVHIKNATVNFTPSIVRLADFNATTGKTDFNASGTLENLLGFVFKDQDIKGRFKATSTLFSLDDFMVETTSAPEQEKEQNPTPTQESTTQEQIKIPSFLDCSISVLAKTVLYDNLTLKNTKADLVIKDQSAALQNVSAETLGGKITLNGMVSTKQDTPVFDIKVGIASFDIASAFKELVLFKSIAPIAGVLQGKLNTTLSLSGNLNPDLTPDLGALNGDAFAQIAASAIAPENVKALQLLENNLSFLDFKNINLKNLQTHLSFKNGTVQVKPFTIKHKDIGIQVQGSHRFNNQMQYQMALDVPAKYLGNQVGNTLAKLQKTDLENLKIPVSATISGTALSPKIKTDLKQAASNIAGQIVEKQKQALVDKTKKEATKAVESALESVTGSILKTTKDSTKTDSTQKQDIIKPVKNIVNGALNNLFKKKK